MRQSTQSAEIQEKILQLKQMSQSSFNSVISFWTHSSSDIGIYWEIYDTVSRSKSMWEEAILENPNSTKFLEGFSWFLLEVQTDFSQAIRQIQKKNLIEDGHSFMIDHSFRSLVYNYPLYLRQRILDVKGKFVKDNKQSSSSDDHDVFNLNQNFDDVDNEDAIGSSILTHFKTRLAYQRAVEYKKSAFSRMMRIWSVVLLLITIGTSGIIVVINSGFFDGINQLMTEQLYSYQWRLEFDFAMWTILHDIALSNGVFDNSSNVFELETRDVGMTSPFPLNRPNLKVFTLDYLVKGSKVLDDLTSQLSSDSEKDMNVYQSGEYYLNEMVTMPICVQVNISGQETFIAEESPFLLTLKEMASVYAFHMRRILRVDADNVYNRRMSCVVMKSVGKFKEAQNAYSNSIKNYQYKWCQSKKKEALLQLCTIPIAVFIVGFIPYFIFYRLFIKDLKKALTLASKIDDKDRVMAASPISSLSVDISGSTTEIVTNHKTRFIFSLIMITCATLIGPILLIINLYQAMSTSIIFGSLSCWLLYGAALNPLLIESIIHIYIAFTVPLNAGFTNLKEQLNFSRSSVQLLLEYQKAIQLGTDQMTTVSGYNQNYDQVASKLRCDPEYTNDPHMEYSCLGLDQVFQFASGYVDTVWKEQYDYQSHNGDKPLNDPSIGHLIHIFAFHVYRSSQEQSDLLNHLGDLQIRSFQDNLLICIIVNVFASLFAFIWMLYIPRSYDQAFSAAMLVFRRLEPSTVLLNHELTSFLLHQGKSTTRNDMSFSQKVINNSLNPIIIVNSQQIIETANLKVTEIFNYTSEQLIGQTASLMFSNEFKETVHDQMNLMRLGQSHNDFIDHVTCLTSSNQEIPCLLMIIPNGKGSDIVSFSLILNDERELLEKMTQAQQAEEKYKALLFGVFPQDIVPKLTEDHQISFVTHISSVMFINISKFSDFSAALSPSDTLDTLTHVFSGFDSALQNYPMITKLKIVGDSYMCASGLFVQTPSETEHSQNAEQLINFGLECLKALEEVNVSLQVDLTIRIAVHTGGPIFGGVISKDRPFFEILGDPIRTAYFLQTLCVRGQVLISQPVYDLVSACGFIIKPHTTYKIKKQQSIPTYLISYKVQSVSANSSAFSGLITPNSSTFAQALSILPQTPPT